jgi:hypothetical protein
MTTRFYQPNHKQWNHTGFIFPQVEHHAGQSDYPHAEFRPAAWLPVIRQDTRFETWVVCMPGKVLALTREGDVVPAGLKDQFEVASGATALTYTANDYTESVTDLTTGVAYATNGTTTYTQSQVTTALRNRGLIRATEFARDFISAPVGYAPCAMYAWCGGDGSNPSLYKQHNLNMQNQMLVGCDNILRLPLVPIVESAETMGDGSISSAAITFGTTQWHDSTGLGLTTRYSSLVSAGDDVVAYVFAKTPVAKQSNNTPFTCTALSGKTEVDSIAEVAAGGSDYYYVDYEAGVMFVYESGGNAVPSPFVDGTTTITYYTYEGQATGAANIASVLGDVNVGDFLTFDSNSNLVPIHVDIGTAPGAGSGVVYAADPAYATDLDADISAQLEATMIEALTRTVAQVIAIDVGPRDNIDLVRTQFTGLTATERMPGSATGGQTDAQNLSGAAFKTVILNFLAR